MAAGVIVTTMGLAMKGCGNSLGAEILLSPRLFVRVVLFCVILATIKTLIDGRDIWAGTVIGAVLYASGLTLVSLAPKLTEGGLDPDPAEESNVNHTS